MLRVRWAASGLLLTGSLLLTLTACSGSPASYTERMAYLRKTAARGVETHRLLASQGARIDGKRCKDAYVGLANDDIPHDYDDGVESNVTEQWRDQVTAFFVDSCVSGLPRPVPGDPTPTSAPGRTSRPAATGTPPASTTTPAPQPTPTPPLTLHPAPTGTPAPRGS